MKNLQTAFIEAADKLAKDAMLPTYSQLVAALDHSLEFSMNAPGEDGCEECADAAAMLKKIRKVRRDL